MRLQLTKCLFISLLLNSTNIFSVPVRDPNNCRTTYVNILEKMMVNAPDSIIKFTCGKYEEALYKLSDAQVKQLDFFSNVYLNQTVAKEIMLTARNEISPYTSNPIVISNFSNDWAEETLRMLNSKQPIGSRFSHTLKDHVKIMFNEPTMAAKPVFVPQMPTPSAPPVQTHYPTHNNNYNKSFPNYGSLLSVEEERYVQNSKKFVNRLLHLEDRNLFCVFSTRDSQLLEYFLTQESVKTKSSAATSKQANPLYIAAFLNLFDYKINNVYAVLAKEVDKNELDQAFMQVRNKSRSIITRLNMESTNDLTALKKIFHHLDDQILNETNISCCTCSKPFIESDVIGQVNELPSEHYRDGTSCKAKTCKQCATVNPKKYDCGNCTLPVDKNKLDEQLRKPSMQQTFKRPL